MLTSGLLASFVTTASFAWNLALSSTVSSVIASSGAGGSSLASAYGRV